MIPEGPLSIVDVLAAATSRSMPAMASSEESRFPVTVTGETRAWLDAQAKVLGTSLAGLCGTILNEVAAESVRRALASPPAQPVRLSAATATETFEP